MKALLDSLSADKNNIQALYEEADPLQIAKIYNDEFIALLCALFAYGNARNILNFLKKLDFSLLDSNENKIIKESKGLKYRFQNEKDIAQIFISLRRLKQEISLNELFTKAYLKNENITEAIKAFLEKIYKLNPYQSYGYNFFFGKIFDTIPKSTFKRINMYLRWMVRKDELDMGLFTKIHTKDLLIPLDTHTHRVSLDFKLMTRKIYDFKAVEELTFALKKFSPNDPCKYDFALYRLGQLKNN